jgi:hypothetical protein
MRRQRAHFFKDTMLVVVSIGVAIYIVQSGAVHEFATSLSSFALAGTFLAGMLFTSIFTTAPAIVILGELAQEQSLIGVALVGAMGAVVGDFILFQFVRGHVKEDVDFLLSYAKRRGRFRAVFKTKLFRSLTPFLGALIALLGLSGVHDRSFIYISFVMNALGILAIGLIATQLTWPW